MRRLPLRSALAACVLCVLALTPSRASAEPIVWTFEGYMDAGQPDMPGTEFFAGLPVTLPLTFDPVWAVERIASCQIRVECQLMNDGTRFSVVSRIGDEDYYIGANRSSRGSWVPDDPLNPEAGGMLWYENVGGV